MSTRPRTTVAIVGAGTMGRMIADTLRAGSLAWRAELVGIADRDPAAATRFGADCEIPSAATVDELIETTKPDAVYLAVPDDAHARPFLDCAERGVGILVEKPLATTMADAELMQAAALNAGVVAEVNFSNRFNPPFVRAQEAIARGDIGDVVGISGRLSNVIDYPAQQLRWAGTTTCGWFLLSHLFDVVRWITQAEAVRIHGVGSKGRLRELGIDTYDLMHALVEYRTGVSGIYESAWVLPPSLGSLVDFNVQIVGSQGRILIDTHSQMVQIATPDHLWTPGTLDWTATRLEAFLDAVDRRQPDATGIADGVANTAMLVALHESVRHGSTVDVAETASATADAPNGASA